MTIAHVEHHSSTTQSQVQRRTEVLSAEQVLFGRDRAFSVSATSFAISGGDAPQIKLTRELSKRATGETIYLLDEPTTGLPFHDVKKLIAVLNDLVAKGNTVVVIEHNLDVVKSDHVIDLGHEGGDAWGYVVAAGTPEEIVRTEESYTGQFLGMVLEEG